MIQSPLHSIRIVLVQPLGPLNLGAIARVMKNMGLKHLYLVNPQCDPLGPEARQMAVHAADILESARVVHSLPQALQGCQRAIATTGKPRTLAATLEPPGRILPWLLEADQENSAALLFGPEDRGLDNTELNYAQRFLSIPTSSAYPSLNLAQAVGICCYELYQLAQREDYPHSPPASVHPMPPSHAPASLDILEGYYQHLEALLLQIGYLYPHTANRRMQKFRRLLSRALPSREEVALLRGMVSQVEWAMRQAQPPQEETPHNRPEN